MSEKKKNVFKNGINILSFEGIDLFFKDTTKLRDKDGKIIYKQYKNNLDYSLDLLKLTADKEFYFMEKVNGKTKIFSDKVINVTFKRAVHTKYSNDKNIENEEFKMPTYNIRLQLYTNGFKLNGLQYIYWKRSTGSARKGKCLFIEQSTYNKIKSWEMCGIKIKKDCNIDLASFEAYKSLTLSSIIDTINIKPSNILVMDKLPTSCRQEVFTTREVNGKLITKKELTDVTNDDIWDGQGLIDISMFSNEYQTKYNDICMLLLRNRFFKSACFSTDIQQWFKDNDITEVSQLNGETKAKQISDIKLIVTTSSIKYLKFGTLENWFRQTNSSTTFGIVKTEKPTYFFDGRMVQTHYQLLNSLLLTKNEVKEFVQPTVDYINLLKTNVPVLLNHLKINTDTENYDFDKDKKISKNDIYYKLLNNNPQFTQTQLYRDFVNTLVDSYKDNAMQGHILVDGNYSTLLACPVEMLQHAIKQFDGTQQLQGDEIHTTNFAYGKELVCTRSPHIASGNILVTTNKANALIDKYINLSSEIVVINTINSTILQRLQGADMDSDTLLITDNQILLDAAKRNYDKFLVPCNFVQARGKVDYKYNNVDKARLDHITKNAKIGEIVNLSQNLNSIMFNEYLATGKINEDIYTDIAQLSSMSGIAIDSAKKNFNCNLVSELIKIRSKYDDLKDNKSYFFKHIDKNKSFNKIKKAEQKENEKVKDYKKYNCTMNYVVDKLEKVKLPNFKPIKKQDKVKLIDILDKDVLKNYRTDYLQQEMIDEIVSAIKKYKSGIADLKKEADAKERFKLKVKLDEYFLSLIEDKKLNKTTIIELLTILENDDNSIIRGYMFNMLFSLDNSFINQLINSTKSRKDIIFLQETDKMGNIRLYNFRYNYVKSDENSIDELIA